MQSLFKVASLALALTVANSAAAQMADESEMMSACNSYAASHLGVSPSQITELYYNGIQDGHPVVDGGTASGLAFRCTLGHNGHNVVSWSHTAPENCPAGVSEADRYLYPGCN